MSQTKLVEPDIGFIKDVVAEGGDTLKKCFQCATCSVVCNLSPDDRPFPRKEMVWTQWGLKDRLARDPDVWLCHQCNDCTKYCPRGAKPGDVLAVLRRQAILANGFPQFVAKMVNNPKWLPVVFGIPVVLLLLFMAAAGIRGIPDGEIIYRNFIPQWPVVDVLFPLTAVWAMICAAAGVRRLWAGFNEGAQPEKKEYRPSVFEFSTLYVVPTIVDILKHSNFKECVVNRIRYLAHLNMLWGFVLLFVTTSTVFIGVYTFGKQTPYPLSHPIKWIGNIGAIILIVGSLVAVKNRLSQGEDAGKATYFDWLFLIVVLATGISGLLTELLRLANVPGLAYPMYFIHLVFVWFLFAYLPFSKFAHILYRTTAMVYARYTGRKMRKGTAVSVVRPPETAEAATSS